MPSDDPLRERILSSYRVGKTIPSHRPPREMVLLDSWCSTNHACEQATSGESLVTLAEPPQDKPPREGFIMGEPPWQRALLDLQSKVNRASGRATLKEGFVKLAE